MKKIRVMIIEDSPVVREYLEHIIGGDPRLEVAAITSSAEEALRILDEVAPDVISMDIRLPGMNGFEATRKIMSRRPTPIVVVSASVESEDLKISMNALRAGALAIVEKPFGSAQEGYDRMAERICTQLAIMSQVRVIRQRAMREADAPPGPLMKAVRPPPVAASSPIQPHILGIVASTGGPNALVTLLNGLPPSFPLPILLVQHITTSFLDGFVSWLNDVNPFAVSVAKNGELPMAGNVYVAPGDMHLKLNNGRLRIERGEPVSGQRPSGTVLFQSMAASLGRNALAVLLTGMGDDGAAGLLDIKKAGGYTLAEDASTAVVYGMPARAVELGAVCQSLPIHGIAPRILEFAPTRRPLIS